MIKYFILFLVLFLNSYPITNSITNTIKTNKISKEKKALKRYTNFLKYGTFSQKIEVIKIISKNKNLSKLIKYTKQDFIKNEFFGINVLNSIETLKSKNDYDFLDIIVENKSNLINKSYFKLLKKSLSMINSLKLEKYKKFLISLYKLKNNDIKIQCIKGIGIFKIKEYKEKIKKLFKVTENVYVKSEIIKSVSKFAEEEDINFLEKVIFSDLSSPINQWISVVSLKTYIGSKKAENLLIKNLSMNDIEIKSRALYALSFFNNKKIYKLLLEYTQNDSPRLRYFAVKGLENYNTDEVNNILQFKYHNDGEIKIKNLAKKILVERKIIKVEKKKDGTTNK